MRKPVRINRASSHQPTPARPITTQARTTGPAQQNSAFGRGCGVVIAIVVALFLIGKCTSGSSDAPSNSTQAALSEPAYVSARSLNCRREPDASAAVSEGLARNDQVIVAERRGDWARLTRGGGDCWVFNSFLASAPSDASTSSDSSPPQAQGLMSSGAGATVAAAGASYVAGKTVKSSRKHALSKRRGSSRSRRGSRGSFYGSGCPCSGSQVCIGPRGGRYCITSGGNKRYGV